MNKITGNFMSEIWGNGRGRANLFLSEVNKRGRANLFLSEVNKLLESNKLQFVTVLQFY